MKRLLDARIFYCLALLLTLVVLGGCEKPAEPPAKPILVGTNGWVGYLPGYIARDKGLYGTDLIQIEQYKSALYVMEDFRKNKIQVAALTIDGALELAQEGIPIKIILVTNISEGADVIIAKPGITSIKDLAGRRVGLEDSGLGFFILERAMEINGMAKDSVRRIPIIVDESVDAYLYDRVDAVVTFEPYRGKLLALGGVNIFSSKQLPNEIIDVLVIRAEYADANPRTLRALAKGWLSAAAMINKDRNKLAKELAWYLKIPSTEVPAAFDGLMIPDARRNRALLDDSDPILLHTNSKIVDFMEDHYGRPIKQMGIEIYTDRFIPETD